MARSSALRRVLGERRRVKRRDAETQRFGVLDRFQEPTKSPVNLITAPMIRPRQLRVNLFRHLRASASLRFAHSASDAAMPPIIFRMTSGFIQFQGVLEVAFTQSSHSLEASWASSPSFTLRRRACCRRRRIRPVFEDLGVLLADSSAARWTEEPRVTWPCRLRNAHHPQPSPILRRGRRE